MNQEFISKVFISSLLVGGLVASSLQANAEGFHEGFEFHQVYQNCSPNGLFLFWPTFRKT